MANQHDWRNAATLPTGEGGPEDASWAFGAVSAPTTDIFPDADTVPPPPAAAPSQIVFIEGSVADYQILADGVQPGVKVVVLNPDADGVQQIADYLQQHHVQGLDAVSIVADGADGELQLGSTLLSASNVAGYQPQLAEIGAALKPGGDLLIYGCDVAQNGAGDAFLGDLAAATGVANIAAASHVVGAAADGGSFNLDVDLGTAATATGPFTPATVAAYPDLLGVTSTVAWYSSFLGSTGGSGVYNVDVNGSTPESSQTDVQSTPGYAFGDVEGVAIDAPYGHYFVSNLINPSGNDINQILEGNTSGSGTPSVIYTSGQSGGDAIIGVALNPQNGLLYFAVTDANVGTSNTDTGIYTINARGSGTQTASELVNLSSGTQAPNDIAIDTTHNLLFYTDGVPGLTGVEEVGVANLTTGSVINGDLVDYQGDNSGDQEPYGIAVNPLTDTLYWTTVNFSATAGNAIFSATYSTGASVALSNIQTLATTNESELPIGIALDTPAGGYYVATESGSNSAQGRLLFGSSLTTPESLTSVFTVPQVSGEDVDPQAIVVETQPTVTASGTVTFDEGGSAVAVDPGAAVPADADGNELASATVSIASGVSPGDTLNFTNQNGITGSFNSGTLTLTGVATEANYQTALDSVTFSTASTSTTARTLDWTVSDGYVSSPATTSTVDVRAAPTITAGAIATFDGGGSPVALDSGLVVSDPSSSTLAAAKIVILGSIGVDRLNFTNQNGISGVFNNGTLSLSGTTSVGNYQTALESITYSVSPSNSDPTGGGGNTSRTIDWSVSDGVLNSGTVTSTVDTVHVKPTVIAGATATFDGGRSAVVLDSGLALSDVDSGGVLSSATVTIASPITGDTLNFSNTNSTTEGNVAVASDSNGMLVLTSSGSTATLAQWQTALESVDYSFTPTDGDPTGGGSHTSRTIDWVVSDGSTSNGISSTSTSTLDTVHVAPTVTTSGTVTYPEGGLPVVLDSGVIATDPDSGGNLIGATVTISGVLSTDSLNFINQNGITGSYNSGSGVLTLTGTTSIANYETALSSVTYSNSGDPTDGNTDNSRTVSWVVKDGAANSAASDSLLTTLCFCAGTRIRTPIGEAAVQCLAVGDAVLTASGATRKIVWIGMGRVLVTSGHRSAATPVIVRKGALARNVPHHDLRVSKGHALLVDGVLIPVEFLVNHRSILWDDRVREVSLYHVELDSHDVLLANGAPAESYRDDGNRWLFHNANSGWGLPPQEPCRPVLTGGPIVDAAWRRLLDRAGPRPGVPLTDDPDLHLLVDGKRIDRRYRPDGRWVFAVRTTPEQVRIVSHAVVPAELGLARDSRPLGVAIRRVYVWQGMTFSALEAADPRLAVGFHAFEPDNGYRWTDGDAVVPRELFAGAEGPFRLELEVAETTRYPLLAAA
jgi:hypothetical protein